jgi:diguanylate cyclase (GGDEF)-like protein/PAS domain S-box-containing protein
MKGDSSRTSSERLVRSKVRVLLVDDLPEDRARVAAIVTQDVAPVDLQEVEDHVGFFQCLRENLYDIVITEQDLHWSSGQEVLNAVKSLRPAAPVIMLARSADESVAAAAFRDGLDAYIPKSGGLAIRLRASLRSALRRLEFEQRIDGLEDRMEHLLDRLDVAVFRTTTEGELIEANPAFQRLFGAILGHNGEPRMLASLFEDQAAHRELADRLAAEGQVRSFQVGLRRGDGSTAWVSMSVTRRKGVGAIEVIDGLAEDVTAARHARQALLQARDELRAVFEHSGAAVAVLEADGTIAMVNSAFERFSGLSRVDLEGVETWSRFLPIAERDRIADRRRVLLAAPETSPRSGNFDFVGRDGRRRRVHATETALPGGRRSVVSLVNVSERQQVEDQLLHNAFHDGLTGLPNRLSLFERLGALEERPGWEPAAGTALIMFDLDGFRQVNDRYGHRVGDLLLRAVTRRVEGAVPAIDTLARCGSDTFAMLLHPIARGAPPAATAEAIVEAIKMPFRFGDRTILCTASVGVAWAGDRRAIGRLFGNAEAAMYEARRQGGARWLVYDEDGPGRPRGGSQPPAGGETGR